MSKHARDRRPYIKPVTRLELSETNIKIRWIAIAVLLTIAVVAIGYGFSVALSTEPGWQEVTAISKEVNCSGDFVLMYDFAADGINPTAQYKKLETLYTQLTEEGYRLFHAESEGTDNLHFLNANVNKTVTVAPALYRALEQIAASESRHPFMGPVRELYAPVFLAATDVEAALYDPMKDSELAAMAGEIAVYGADPAMISLEIFDDNQVRLNVAQEYLSFGEEYGMETFLDLGWMTNAFIIDYMADSLAAEGYTCGYLASYDGFTRNLDIRSTLYSQNIFHCRDHTVYMPAILDYSGPMSLVALRNYPMSDRDRWNYYAYGDGTVTTVFLDPADGMSRTSIDGLTAYSRDAGCADILLKIAPVFIAEDFDTYGLEILAQEGIQSVRCYESSIVCTEETWSLLVMDDSYTLTISNVE